MARRRYSYIHGKVRELGFLGLGEYLTQRYVLERVSPGAIATECDVRENTVRRQLRLYGIDTNHVKRLRPSTTRRGRNLICNSCGAGKYYSPAVLRKLDERKYLCRPCKGVIPDVREAQDPADFQPD